MKKFIEILKEIETKNDTTTFKCGNASMWPIIRIYSYFYLRNKHSEIIPKKGLIKLRSFLTKTLFYFKHLTLIKNVFKKIDYLVISDNSELRLLDNKTNNKLFFEVFNLKSKNYLYFEKPADTVMTRDIPNTQSALPIYILSKLVYPFINPKLSNLEQLDDLLVQHNINIPVKKLIKKFYSFTVVIGFLFKFMKPKVVFISDYYNLLNFAWVFVAKSSKIPVIEFQHGIINSIHPAYNFFCKYNEKMLKPDYLFYYLLEKNINWNNFYLPKDKCHNIGHPYLQYILATTVKEPNRYRRFQTKILVTLQWTDEKQVIPFINRAAKSHPNKLFILLPRERNKNYSLNLTDNVIIEKSYNFYELLRLSDIHTTTYSTCALEANAIGIPNILINFENYSKLYFENFLNESHTFRYINNLDEFNQAISTLEQNSMLHKDSRIKTNNTSRVREVIFKLTGLQ